MEKETKSDDIDYGKFSTVFKVMDKHEKPRHQFSTWTIENAEKVLTVLKDVIPPAIIDEMIKNKGKAVIKIVSVTEQPNNKKILVRRNKSQEVLNAKQQTRMS